MRLSINKKTDARSQIFETLTSDMHIRTDFVKLKFKMQLDD